MLTLEKQAVVLLVLICFIVFLPVKAFAQPETKSEIALTLEDYPQLRKLEEVSLSSDGEFLAYIVSGIAGRSEARVRRTYVGRTNGKQVPEELDIPANARSISWVPGRNALSFLAPLQGNVQLQEIDIETGDLSVVSKGQSNLVSYRYSPNGAAIAWVVRETKQQSENSRENDSLFARMFRGNEGVVIDPASLSWISFLDETASLIRPEFSDKIWIKSPDDKLKSVNSFRRVKALSWSSDSQLISIAGHTPDGADANRPGDTSLSVYDLTTRLLTPLFRAGVDSSGHAFFFEGGEWIPNTQELFVRKRTIVIPGLVARTEYAECDVLSSCLLPAKDLPWKEIQYYAWDEEPAFLVKSRDLVLSNKTVRAKQSLFELSIEALDPLGFRESRLFGEFSLSVSKVRFDRDFRSAVFVGESLTQPQELYYWRKGQPVRQVTGINRATSKKRMPDAQEVNWLADDGTRVQGWLLLPPSATAENGPLPMVTFLHGGPSVPYTDQYEFYYSEFGGIWPYPFNLLALNGIAVFIPNYRGTLTFGDSYPFAINSIRAPVNDVLSGIEDLISRGIADPDRLGIAGHSHGGGLGPYIMVQSDRFAASAFAEGSMSMLLTYALASEEANTGIQNTVFGGSLYDDPDDLIEMSAELHLKGLTTPVLLEAGAKSSAMLLLSGAKAARNAGMPTEFVVYPVEHNITWQYPDLQIESAERNLDWFLFWLRDFEDSNPEKSEQYDRWRSMRLHQCAELSSTRTETPVYCNASLGE